METSSAVDPCGLAGDVMRRGKLGRDEERQVLHGRKLDNNFGIRAGHSSPFFKYITLN